MFFISLGSIILKFLFLLTCHFPFIASIFISFLSSNQTCLFDHEQIEKVYHYGLVDEEEEKFKAQLNELILGTNTTTEEKNNEEK